MYVNAESLVLGWPDYVMFVGILILYTTFRVFIYSKPYIRYRLKWFTAGDSRWSLDESEATMMGPVKDVAPSASLGTTTMILFIMVITLSTETYRLGMQLIYLLIAHILASVFMAHLYMPLFHELEMNNIQEYLDVRFNRPVRLLSLFPTFCQLFFQMAFIMCVPSLAFAQLTAYPLWLAVLLTGIMASTYTAANSFRLSLWSNIFQVLIGLVAPVTIIILGIIDVGGNNSFRSSVKQGGLLTYNSFDINPLTEYSFFTLVFGGFGVILSILATHPVEIEQFSCTILRRKAKLGIYIRMLISWIFFLLLLTCGLIYFVTLYGCNPKAIELTKHDDQTPSAALLILGFKKPTFKGFILSCLYAGSLSAITTTATSFSSLIVHETMRSSVKLNIEKRTPGGLQRWISFGLCLLCIPVSYGLLQIPTSLFQSAITFVSAFASPLLIIVCVGMFIPGISNAGAISGLFFSQLVGLALLVMKVYSYAAPGRQMLFHSSTKLCFNLFPVITLPTSKAIPKTPEGLSILDFSFWYIPALCIISGLLFAFLFSIPSRFNANRNVDARYLAWPTRAVTGRVSSSDSQLVDHSESSIYNDGEDDSEQIWSESTFHRSTKNFRNAD